MNWIRGDIVLKDVLKREKWKDKCKKIRIFNNTINEINSAEIVAAFVFLGFCVSICFTKLLWIRILVCIVLPLSVSGCLKAITMINNKRCELLESKINKINEKIDDDFESEKLVNEKENELHKNNTDSKEKSNIIYLKEIKKVLENQDQVEKRSKTK